MKIHIYNIVMRKCVITLLRKLCKELVNVVLRNKEWSLLFCIIILFKEI